jgi:hypothetical protein
MIQYDMILFSIDIVKLIGNTIVEYCQNCQKPSQNYKQCTWNVAKSFQGKFEMLKFF